MDFHQFFYNERLMHSKMHLNRSLCIEFEENRYSRFLLRESLPTPKIGLLNFHRFFGSKRLLRPKMHQKGNLYVGFEETRSSCFFETRTSEH